MKTLVLEYESPVALDNTIYHAIQHEIERLALAIRLSKNALLNFEQHYNMASNEFFEKMEQGELDDSADFVEWAGEYELLQRAEEKLYGLRNVKICS